MDQIAGSPPPPGPTALSRLAEGVRVAREEVQLRRAPPAAHDRLLSAHQALLRAMEAYADELTLRGLPLPRRLRDDLRLHRIITTMRDRGR
jgi:hypothetical protein